MEENRRQAYLHALGIECYSPRTGSRKDIASSGKPDSNLLMNPAKKVREILKPLDPVVPQEINQTPPRPETVRVQSVVRDEIEVRTPNTSTNQYQNSEAEGEIRFRLQFFPVNEKVAVISETPYLETGGKDANRRLLLLAILSALHLELTEIAEPWEFSWPLHADYDASSEKVVEASLALAGFMNKRLESTNYSHILIFAGQCGQLLGNEGEKNRIFAGTKAQLTLTQSLQAMLMIPQLKKAVWEDIRFLQGQLAADLLAH